MDSVIAYREIEGMSWHPHRVAFGERLRELRREHGLSQEAFAHHVGLDRTYVSGLERGRRNPTLAVIVKLAEALEVQPAALLEWREMPPENDAH